MRKLGRLPARRDPGVACLAQFTRGLALPPPPVAVDYYSAVAGNWSMSLNDEIGDCTIAAVAHCAMLWSANAQSEAFQMTDAEVLKEYSRITGYDPRRPATDQGAVVQDVMDAWCGEGIDTSVLDGRVNLNITDLDEIRDAINWFGCAYIGINCPRSALDNVRLWDVVRGSPIEGGHAIMLAGYDRRRFYAVSWGLLIPVTGDFLLTYMDEAVGPIDRAFIAANGKTPAGLSLNDLLANANRLGPVAT